MASTPYPLPREIRQSTILVGNGTAGPYGPTTFKMFDTADIDVWTKPAGQVFFKKITAFTVAKTSGAALDTVSVTFTNPVANTTSFVIASRRTHERTAAVLKAGALDADQLEKELSKQGTVLEELRRDVSNTLQLPPGSGGRQMQLIAEGHIWKADEDGNQVDGGLLSLYSAGLVGVYDDDDLRIEGDKIPLRKNVAAWARPRVQTTVKWYVDSASPNDLGTGSDSSKWKTFGKAMAELKGRDLADFNITVYGAGVFPENIVRFGSFVGDSSTLVELSGPEGSTNPFDCVIAPPSGAAITAQHGGRLGLRCMSLNGPAQGGVASRYGEIYAREYMDYGACRLHMLATRYGYYEQSSSLYTISDSRDGPFFARHFEATHGGEWRWAGTGSPVARFLKSLDFLNFGAVDSHGTGVITTVDGSVASFDLNGFTVTGRRLEIRPAGTFQWVSTLGGSPTALPGSTAILRHAMGAYNFGPSYMPPSIVRPFSVDISVNGTFSVTGCSMKPSSIIVIGAIDQTPAGSIGFGAYNTSATLRFNSGITAGTLRSDQTQLGFFALNASDYASMTLVSLDDDGFTYQITKAGAPTGTVDCYALCIF